MDMKLKYDSAFWKAILPPEMHRLNAQQKLHLVFSLVIFLQLSLSKLLFFIFLSNIQAVQERVNVFMAYRPSALTFHAQFSPPQIFDMWADPEQFPKSQEAVENMIEEVACRQARKEDILHPSKIIDMYKELAPFMWNILMAFTLSLNKHRVKLEQKKARTSQEITGEDSDSDWDDDPNVLDDSGRSQGSHIPEGFSRDPVLAVMATISMLVFVNNHSSNALQLVLGLFFKTNGTSSRVLSILSNIGLSVSAMTIEHLKKHISDDAIQLAIEVMLGTGIWAIIFDNINIFLRKHSQQVTNCNTMIHATNVAIINIDNEGIDKEAALDLHAKLSLQGERQHATFADILPTHEDDTHLEGVFDSLIAEIIVRYSPGSKYWKGHKQMLEKIKELMPHDCPLPPKKSDARPFGVFDVNEGSKSGILEVLDTIREHSTMTQDEFSSKTRPVLGDWLTSSNLRGSCRDCADNVNSMERIDYADELSQLFHFALQATHMIMCAHYSQAVSDPTSLASHKGLLDRRWDVEKPNYAAAKSLIWHSLIACILHILMYYSQLQSWEPKSLEEVLHLAQAIRISYATTTAARKAKSAQDDYSAHDVYFIRDALLFFAFEDGVSYADAGRILQVLKYWCFAFRRVGQHNYAQEFLERSWFFNCWGTVGRNIAFDLYLEQLNFWVKRVFIASGSGVTVEYIIDKGSACVEAFHDISHLVAHFLLGVSFTKLVLLCEGV
ncbi:hypothetical protein BDP27DRAFT_1419605 [Rhodocollybia butyracea]|uniref:DUF6589 domain-containing protein n=1 Tax=Rhodocollybia butyracea TaxID=206335 RepID=A0A9P5UA99_9AGAR|nr:hypothetical protein BDP27DRAFT_1419605 [Rhodocollybia butyracea]